MSASVGIENGIVSSLKMECRCPKVALESLRECRALSVFPEKRLVFSKSRVFYLFFIYFIFIVCWTSIGIQENCNQEEWHLVTAIAITLAAESATSKATWKDVLTTR